MWWGLAIVLAACGRLHFDDAGEVVPTAPLVVEPRYAQAPAWNDYLERDGTVCVSECFHAGEERRVLLPGVTSCTGITATDALSALQWRCDDSSGDAIVFGTGLRGDRGLRDLVDASGWKPNSVRVTFRNGELRTTTPETWWPNPVRPLPDNSGGAAVVALADAGAVYVLAQSRTTGGYSIEADRVALVLLPGATLGYELAAANCNELTGEVAGGGQRCMVTAGSQRFLWIEGTFDALDIASYGVHVHTVQFSQLRGVRVATAALTGIALVNVSSSRAIDLTANNNGIYGVLFDACTNTVLHDVHLFGNGTGGANGSAGILVSDSSRNVLTKFVVAHDYNYGVLGYLGSLENTYSHVTAANSPSHGVDLQDSGGNALVQVLGVNNATNVRLQSTNNHVAQLAAAHGVIGLCVSSLPNVVERDLRVGDHSLNDCRSGAVCESPEPCSGLPGLPSVAALDARSALNYKVITGDATNDSDTNGQAAAATAVANWLDFDHPFRGWGADGSSFPADDNRPICAAGCRIWDWRHRDGDTAIAIDSMPFTAGQPCPPSSHGDVAVTDAIGNTFLINALERLGDGIGDDDSLCESNEACVRSAYFGADQPAGASTCTFSDGAVSGVTMFGS